ncbi:MAG: type II toxin-antitoxin system RelB/DinJ family antitoxin [Coriobacteriia bacterium]|nr:type II toxin-antitoxin system RelB/DinJ family antitoxin [Coriobacteriia bacterium]
MDDAMVTARVPRGKKQAGNAVIAGLGETTSGVINRLYDYIIANGALPFERETGPSRASGEERARALREAQAWADEVCLPEGNRFATMTDDQIRAERLRDRGLM